MNYNSTIIYLFIQEKIIINNQKNNSIKQEKEVYAFAMSIDYQKLQKQNSSSKFNNSLYKYLRNK